MGIYIVQTVIARNFKSLSHTLKNIDLKKNKIGLVPTMGCLHDGHLELIKKSKKLNYFTIVTIFINPLQFNNKADLKSYPSKEKTDIILLKKNKVNLIFIPNIAEVYPKNYSTYLYESSFSKILCGKHRKNHFSGVTTIVLKLFLLIKPNFVFFGEKDFQQLVIISKIVKDLNLDLKIIKVPTVRDEYGLALSSRNNLLSKKNLLLARKLYQSLKKVEEYKTKDVKHIINKLKTSLKKLGITNIEYLEIRESINLKTPRYIDEKKETRVFVAVNINKVRLIDNYVIKKISPRKV